MKSKVVAGLLAIFLGGFGIHKFYLGQTGQGILMLLFAWTGIPEIIGIFQGVLMLLMTKKDFDRKYN
ncbi:TM2 domain-containing protein [Clostridium sp. D2Q-11]|uniref:TM2 domain-containing protein n=1 Tax=Anaeromonas frigoriresistens TaxID=2683708 RepID=A0A942UWB4_9FIRM|nr:TM2 domain-containing protein [Anaeromonas frigoriresistens]MBS4538091.1 TM2 domain-containing protein [Anaeromonas frigoriresistens]